MLPLIILVCFTIPWSNGQGVRNQRPFNNGHGWDIRLAVPGQPGNDYPTLNSIPRTSFTCSGKEPGYYADMETNCQVFRVCTLGSTFGFQSFICPNGTLFNQQVFVCDWWMNVNCQKSKELFNNNNDKFGNLKLGSQFMSDIKNMIMHPAKNPYDRSQVRSNLVFMQVYKPPPGQLYNEALLRNLEKNTNDIFVKKKQAQKSYQSFSTADYTAAASTPTTQYIPNYIFQSQAQTKPTSITFNAHTGQITQTNKQNYQNYNNNKQPTISPTSQYRNLQYPIYNNPINKSRQALFGVEFSKQQINQDVKKETPLYPQGNTQVRYSKDFEGRVESETKQNLVSKDTPPKLITKTLAFRKVVKDPKNGTPKSRITFKTWIVRPSKAAKLIKEPTSYTYNDPNNIDEKIRQQLPSDTENLSNLAKTELKINTNDISYKYNPPTINLITPSTTPRSILSSYSSVPPTKESLTDLVPTTFNPLSLSYLPPISNAKQLSRQYLLPSVDNNNIELVAAGSSPTPFFKLPLIKNEPKFSLVKQSLINTNRNNLTFTDILTKEKLDISVNDIVKDTNNILLNASPEPLIQAEQEQSVDYPAENYLPAELNSQSGEILTLQPPPPLPQSSRLISTPSPNIEPPLELMHSSNVASNKLSNLPYIKESFSQPNTIERMVSLKITIPENIAKYLFNRQSNDTNKLEILNTANSNYLVLTNHLAENSGAKLIPIGKLSKNTNLSNSQDLVFSLLADSINAARDYSNIAQQNLLTPAPTQPQFQNIKNENFEQIAQDITHLTSSQFSANAPSRNANSITNTTFTQNQQTQPLRNNALSTQKDTIQQIYSTNSDKIYSGQLYQLPVPVVTRQFYNSPKPSISNYILSSNFLPTNDQTDFNSNKIQRSNSDVEIIPSQIIPTDTYQTQLHQSKLVNQDNSANAYVDNFRLPTNGIRAQVHDNIIGTIPHPLEEDKLIKYKKDQSYYIFTHLNNNNGVTTYGGVNSKIRSNNGNGNQESIENKGNMNPLTFQVVPSVGYKLEDEKERRNFLNVFHLDESGTPKRSPFYSKESNIRRRQDIISDIDFAINHPKIVENSNYLSALYDGPSSYSAPQASIGSLKTKQNIQDDTQNSSREKVDTFDNTDGYPRIIPQRKFLFK